MTLTTETGKHTSATVAVTCRVVFFDLVQNNITASQGANSVAQ